jgi:hypothetical protein
MGAPWRCGRRNCHLHDSRGRRVNAGLRSSLPSILVRRRRRRVRPPEAAIRRDSHRVWPSVAAVRVLKGESLHKWAVDTGLAPVFGDRVELVVAVTRRSAPSGCRDERASATTEVTRPGARALPRSGADGGGAPPG